MIYAFITFAVGIVMGGSIARFYTGRRWQRRLAVVRSGLLKQYTSDIQAEVRQRAAAEDVKTQLEKREVYWRSQSEDWVARERSLTQQLADTQSKWHTQAHESAQRTLAEEQKARALQSTFRAQLEEQQQRYIRLETKYQDYRQTATANVETALKESVSVETRNLVLAEANEQLKAEVVVMQAIADKKQKEWEEQLNLAYYSPDADSPDVGSDVDFGDIITKLFP